MEKVRRQINWIYIENIKEFIKRRNEVIDQWFMKECGGECDPKTHLKGAVGLEDIDGLKKELDKLAGPKLITK